MSRSLVVAGGRTETTLDDLVARVDAAAARVVAVDAACVTQAARDAVDTVVAGVDA